ncbi:hypothetical protein BJAS_P1485 [Bathymodiolus japonicus methanotrophic gill symbiont]|nr:hypothetical protein BJAS_P1485 [Bathymodiolus japonicus methanotrophic gill symbiont]
MPKTSFRKNSDSPIAFLFTTVNIQAQPASPVLQLNTDGLHVQLHWSEVDNAAGYRLSYAPYPYLGLATINSLDMGTETDFAIDLWQGAAFYVALQAYDAQNQNSDYSNIGFLQIQERDANYRLYWRKVSKEVSEHRFTSNDFLYNLKPNVSDCFAGLLNEQAQFRQLDAFNQTRKLHQLSELIYASDADHEVQQASLIQRANNFLSHTPSTDVACYSQARHATSRNSGTPVAIIRSPTQRMGDALNALRPQRLRTKAASSLLPPTSVFPYQLMP